MEELAVAVDGLTVEQPPNDVERDVGAPASRGRIDLADLELVTILAADAHADRDPPRRELGEGRDLAGGDQRVAQRQQEHAEVQPEPGLHAAHRGEPNRPVDPVAADEADMVGGEEVIDPGVGDRREPGPLIVGRQFGEVPRRRDADPEIAHENEFPTVSMLS